MIDIRMTKARSALIADHAFFGALAMRMNIVPTPHVDTMATDGTDLFYRPAFLDELDGPQTRAIVAHEVLHCALGHHVRREGRDHKRWNIACDYVVNAMLRDAGFSLPPWVLLDRKYDGFNAEEVYRILAEEERQQEPPPPEETPSPDQEPDTAEDEQDGGSGPEGDPDDSGDDDGGQDDGGDGDSADDSDQSTDGAGDQKSDEVVEGDPDGGGAGNGEGGEPVPNAHGDPGRCGEILDAAPPHDKAALAEAAEEWEVATRQAVNIARRIGEGKLPGYLEEVVEHLNDPKTDWRDALRRFVDPYSQTKDYSWSHPNRRMLSMGYFVPGLISDGIHHIALVVDTSGSIDTEALKRFGAEAQAALEDGAIDRMTVVFADTEVRRHAEYSKGEIIDFTAVGRGGTNFSPSFAWLSENAPDIACAVYFTDLDSTDFGPEPAFPVMWSAYGSPQDLRRLKPRLPFGECIEINE